jgi:DNA-binding CsgD family transcriptional regulator
LTELADSRGQCAVVVGPPGSGKTTLIEEGLARLEGVDIIRIRAFAAEQDLPLAAVHQLCGALADQAERLPDPQRAALDVALGRRAGAIDRFLVSLAVLGLLTGAAEARPVVCFVDDVERLDEASVDVFAFVAHRLSGEGVSVVFAAATGVRSLQGLPEITLRPLSPDEAQRLVTTAYPGRLAGWAQARVVAEGGGNPATLLALAAEVATDESAGGFAAAPTMEELGRARARVDIERLDPQVRIVLLVAAAQVDRDPGRFRDAVARLGIGPEAVDEAATRRLLDFGPRITFTDRHVRFAAYRTASVAEQRRVHQALADLCVDDDRALRAWHLGQTALETDDAIANTLDDAVEDARAYGGVLAASAFLERAAWLTGDATLRARRLLRAAELKYEVGASEAALRLLNPADRERLDERSRVRHRYLVARLAWDNGDGTLQELLDAARALGVVDPRCGWRPHLGALAATLQAGRLAPAGSLAEAGSELRMVASSRADDAVGALGGALATLDCEGLPTAGPALRDAVAACRGVDDPEVCAIAGRVAAELWDTEVVDAFQSRRIGAARDRGALRDLAWSLDELGALHAQRGELDRARELVDEAVALAARACTEPVLFGPMVIAAWRGDEARAAEMAEISRSLASARGHGELLAQAEYATAVLANGLGRYDQVLACAPHRRADAEPRTSWVLPELVEAATRAGESHLARAHVEQLLERTAGSTGAWAAGMRARSLALVAEEAQAERLYQDAIRHLGATRFVAQRARAHLLYGEWLRRGRRRVDARAQLRIADDLLSSIGATAFATRASRELLATGERARRRTVDTATDLTPREEEIARLAREGESNPQIASRLFISTRTVEYHLRKVFTKLGIASRAELAWSFEPEARRAS